MKTGKAKMWAAAIGSTLTAILVFLGVLSPALDDNQLTVGEVTPLVAAVVTLASTVYAVWRVRNKPEQP